jgi:hypothetical protein
MTQPSSHVALTGACACGNVRFALNDAPITTHCCHCLQCQKSTGSAFSVHAMIERERISVLQGTPETYQGKESHKAVQCPACKARLWSYHPHLGEAIAFVRVGMLDEPGRLQPEAHYFTRSKHPWLRLPAGLPTFDELGDPGNLEARKRVEAALTARP